MNPSFTDLANEGLEDLTGIANESELQTADGWAQIAPYGRWPNSRGLQVFEKADAEEIVRNFKSLWGQLKRLVVGIPTFAGHPDHPDFANIYKDKTEYGQWADLQARDDGLWGRPVFSTSGADLIQGGLKYPSPNWGCIKVVEGGSTVFRPRLLRSVGLTRRPNLPTHSLANAKPETDPAMKAQLIALLAALGRPLANEASATDEQITEALVAAVPVATSLAARPETTALANEQTVSSQLREKLTKVEADLANEQAQHKATATARNEALVDSAIRAGRVIEAQRPVWLSRLERDFANEAPALAAEQPKLKTNGRTENLGDRKPASEAKSRFTDLVNERVDKHGEAYEIAWNAVKATEEGKALIAKMDGQAPAA
ncbi:MAG TPA: phage protease [Opitutaceae bacterium]